MMYGMPTFGCASDAGRLTAVAVCCKDSRKKLAVEGRMQEAEVDEGFAKHEHAGRRGCDKVPAAPLMGGKVRCERTESSSVWLSLMQMHAGSGGFEQRRAMIRVDSGLGVWEQQAGRPESGSTVSEVRLGGPKGARPALVLAGGSAERQPRR